MTRDQWAAVCGVWIQSDGTVIDLWPMRAVVEAARAAAYPDRAAFDTEDDYQAAEREARHAAYHPLDLVEVWCSRCEAPSVAERTVSDGSRTYRAAYCGDCLANLERSSQAARNHARRTAR